MGVLVSVIVPTYRREDELFNALSSLATQTYPNIEIVLVDDNGNFEWNEKVRVVVEKIKEKYPSVMMQCIVNSPNRGSAQTRNIGIESSKGEYITFLDDDDLYLPHKIENQILFMQKNLLDYSVTDLHLYDENEHLVDKRNRTYIEEISKDKLFEYHMKYHITGTDTMMFRREYLLDIGCFPMIDVGDEFYLMQRAIEHDGKFGYLKECEIKAYIHTGSMGLSSGYGKIQGENRLYRHKQKYFNQLNKTTVRYIKSRHHAVLAYAYLRMKRVFSFLMEAGLSFLSSPTSCVKILLNRMR